MKGTRTVVFGGTIHTFETDAPASSVVAEGGRIVEVRPDGAPPPQPVPGEFRLDLAGRTLLPGFIDAHTHLIHWGLKFVRPDLGGTASIDEALERTAEAHRGLAPGRVLLAEGFDDGAWVEPRFPTRADLDRIAPDRPVILRRVCGHVAVANRAALERIPAGPDVDPESGLLVEDAAMGLARLFPPTDEDLDRAVVEAQASYQAMGVTAVHDMSSPDHLRAFARAEARGGLRTTIASILTRPHLDVLARAGLGTGWRRGRITILGVKLFSDGSLGARTAALTEPYADAPAERGLLLLSREELAAAARTAIAAGIPLAVHAIGDRAVRTVVDAFEDAGAAPGQGHRIEHLEMVGDADLERMKRLGLVASLQPNFVGRWGRAGGLYEARLGRERTSRMNPMRTILDRGLLLALGSDAMPAGVLPGLAAAVGAPHPVQRISAREAIRAATVDAARAGGDPEGGRIAPGARADFVVMDRDPIADPEALNEDAAMTIAGGAVVWSR